MMMFNVKFIISYQFFIIFWITNIKLFIKKKVMCLLLCACVFLIKIILFFTTIVTKINGTFGTFYYPFGYFLRYGLTNFWRLLNCQMIYRLKIFCRKISIFLEPFYYPFLSILDNKKVPYFFIFFWIFQILKIIVTNWKNFKKNRDVKIFYAVRVQKFPRLFSGFHFWTFFLSNFENPKILLEKKIHFFPLFSFL